jgi:hypothetical protein
MHIREELLQSYRDGELNAPEETRLREHLAACPQCRRQFESLLVRRDFLSARFSRLPSDPAPPATQTVFCRIQERIETEMERKSMWQTLFSRKYRPVWASLVVVAVLAVTLTVQPVRVLAGKFLRLFRAQQVETVYVDTSQLGEQLKKLRSSSELQKLIAGSFRVEPEGEKEKVESAAEAGRLAGIEVRAPKALAAPSEWIVQPASHVSMDVDLAKVRAILDEIGRQDVQLPGNLDGTNIDVDVPRAVVALFGPCGEASVSAQAEDPDRLAWRYRDCYVLSQVLSPTVTAAGGLDIDEVATAMLQVLGMTAEEAQAFSQTVDWTATLVVPVPRNVSSAETLSVDGVRGSLILQKVGSDTRFLLVWIKNEIVYTLNGWGGKERALSIAQSLG